MLGKSAESMTGRDSPTALISVRLAVRILCNRSTGCSKLSGRSSNMETWSDNRRFGPRHISQQLTHGNQTETNMGIVLVMAGCYVLGVCHAPSQQGRCNICYIRKLSAGVAWAFYVAAGAAGQPSDSLLSLTFSRSVCVCVWSQPPFPLSPSLPLSVCFPSSRCSL